METKHTPGPWAVGGSLIYADDNHRTEVARTLYYECPALPGRKADRHHDDTSRHAPAHSAEADANARLIAAAPELLAALRAMLDMATDSRCHGPEIDQACNVIAKATRQETT